MLTQHWIPIGLIMVTKSLFEYLPPYQSANQHLNSINYIWCTPHAKWRNLSEYGRFLGTFIWQVVSWITIRIAWAHIAMATRLSPRVSIHANSSGSWRDVHLSNHEQVAGQEVDESLGSVFIFKPVTYSNFCRHYFEMRRAIIDSIENDCVAFSFSLACVWKTEMYYSPMNIKHALCSYAPLCAIDFSPNDMVDQVRKG